ncbi:MAG: hypothetical protein K8823_528 [Cenarchaeum symbiont of Oopsacas minuta]|nr:hypothetical protein [Cenarchaeum symbiont of Oopsacas minuta]
MSNITEGMHEMATIADAFTGKKVVDKEGVQYGTVKHIFVGQESLSVIGVGIRYGFRKEYYLPREFIARFTEKTLQLSKSPVRKGVNVMDIDGKKIGKVANINRNVDTGNLESITVSSRPFSSKVIAKTLIWGVGKNVSLNLTHKEFQQLD